MDLAAALILGQAQVGHCQQRHHKQEGMESRGGIGAWVVLGDQAPLLSRADTNNVHQNSTRRINELIRLTQSTNEG